MKWINSASMNLQGILSAGLQGHGRWAVSLKSSQEAWVKVSQSLTSWLGAGTQQVNHIEMVANVNEDLEFRHKGSVFSVCCSFYKYRTKRGITHTTMT